MTDVHRRGAFEAAPSCQERATQSRFRMWWLTRVAGYRMVRVTRTPKPGLFGAIAYTATWWLERR